MPPSQHAAASFMPALSNHTPTSIGGPGPPSRADQPELVSISSEPLLPRHREAEVVAPPLLELARAERQQQAAAQGSSGTAPRRVTRAPPPLPRRPRPAPVSGPGRTAPSRAAR